MAQIENPFAPISHLEGLPVFKPGEVQIFIPKHNSPKKEADATGAFHPGASQFCKIHKLAPVSIHYINNRLSKGGMRGQLLDEMDRVANHTAIWVFFCHGFTHGIQFGLRSYNHPLITPSEAKDFEKFCRLLSSGHPAPLVLLYACSTGDDPDDDPNTAPGSGDGCFADLVRDEICKKYGIYCGVWAHTTAGHSFFNPNLKYFFGGGSVAGGVGGEMLFSPGTPEFRELARKLPLNPDGKGAFWSRFPFIPLETLKNLFSPDQPEVD